MIILRSISAVQKYIKKIKDAHKTIGFVPTMGALHQGHMNLVRQARQHHNKVIVSIFVNPAQFGPSEDFKKYPRQIKQDSLFLDDEKVDAVFYPTAEMMYPRGYLTYVNVESVSEKLCGHYRSGHFRGVATVVAKLLNIIRPDTIYLGQKDGQQVVVLERMVKDLNFPVKVKVIPTVREKDGLAMSSRNRYLTETDRQQAPVLWQALKLAKQMIVSGVKDPARIENAMRAHITQNSQAKIQYIELVDKNTLETVTECRKNFMIAAAIYLGATRLIDNIIV
ncbi:MAG: pantoate--beta-alanine ligase [Candidatus Omnitrophica bacterium]|nr:pantoate--beta-alanine ligase [Candidatus Omnitrophota bacterium]